MNDGPSSSSGGDGVENIEDRMLQVERKIPCSLDCKEGCKYLDSVISWSGQKVGVSM